VWAAMLGPTISENIMINDGTSARLEPRSSSKVLNYVNDIRTAFVVFLIAVALKRTGEPLNLRTFKERTIHVYKHCMN
jgi:hypothetical protein